MKFQIGTDEAGYGPNFGPLTISGTVWKTDDDPIDLYQRLGAVVVRQPGKVSASQLVIADSKIVHRGRQSLRNLELPVLAVVRATVGYLPSNWQELVAAIGSPDVIQIASQQSWLRNQKLSLPVAADLGEIECLSHCFENACQQADVQLTKIHCRLVFADHFNRQLLTTGNKANLLSTNTMQIVRQLLDSTNSNVLIGCDKHGGRNKYVSMIQQLLTDEFVFVGQESLAISDYRFRDRSRDVAIRFAAKGESFLPTALSSMVSKYVREVMMILWNDYWQSQVPGIKPTKGYPQDAKRFKRDIAAKQQALGVIDDAIWRRS